MGTSGSPLGTQSWPVAEAWQRGSVAGGSWRGCGWPVRPGPGGHSVVTLGKREATSGLWSQRGLGGICSELSPSDLAHSILPRKLGSGQEERAKCPGPQGGQTPQGGWRAATDAGRQTWKGRDSLHFTFCLNFGPDWPPAPAGQPPPHPTLWGCRSWTGKGRRHFSALAHLTDITDIHGLSFDGSGLHGPVTFLAPGSLCCQSRTQAG